VQAAASLQDGTNIIALEQSRAAKGALICTLLALHH